VSEIAAYVKSIDNKHLLEMGSEGFYGESNPLKRSISILGIKLELISSPITKFQKLILQPPISTPIDGS